MLRALRDLAFAARWAALLVGVYFFTPALHVLSEGVGDRCPEGAAGLCPPDCQAPNHHHHHSPCHDPATCVACHSLHGLPALAAYAAVAGLDNAGLVEHWLASTAEALLLPGCARSRAPPTLSFALS